MIGLLILVLFSIGSMTVFAEGGSMKEFNMEDLGKIIFSDIENHWAEDEIRYLSSKHIIAGYGDETFRPEARIYRCEFVKLVISALGYNNLSGNQGKWYKGYFDKAVELNILNNNPDESIYIRPEEEITREEAVYVVYNALMVAESRHNPALEGYIAESINDFEEIDLRYKNSVIGAYAKGIVQGRNAELFNPKGALTRAEATVLIGKMINSSKRMPFSSDQVSTFKRKAEYWFEHPIVFIVPEEKKELVDVLTLVDKHYKSYKASNYNKWEMNGDGNSVGIVALSGTDADRSSWQLLIDNLKNGFELEKTPYVLTVWRNGIFEECQQGIESLFKYLFEEECAYNIDKLRTVFDQILKVENLKSDVILEYASNGRKVIIRNTAEGLIMYVSYANEVLRDEIVIKEGLIKYGTKTDSECGKDLKDVESLHVLEVCEQDVIRIINTYTDLLILDVRTPEEYEKGHIDGAINIPKSQLLENMSVIEKITEKYILIYCETGGRSTKVVELLSSKGITNMFHFKNGYAAWRHFDVN